MATSADVHRDLLRAWRGLTDRLGAGIDDLRDALLASWAEPHRTYHDLRHLWHVLQHIDELAGHATDPDAVRLAAWYHDAVHDGTAEDEERSALRAQRELGDAGLEANLVVEVARLIRLTSSHNSAPGDRNGDVLCDADLAILAAPEADYRRYAAAVRAEYAHVVDDAFRVGRTAILQGLLAGSSVFRTPTGRERWEAAARRNLAAEIARLTE